MAAQLRGPLAPLARHRLEKKNYFSDTRLLFFAAFLFLIFHKLKKIFMNIFYILDKFYTN